MFLVCVNLNGWWVMQKYFFIKKVFYINKYLHMDLNSYCDEKQTEYNTIFYTFIDTLIVFYKKRHLVYYV